MMTCAMSREGDLAYFLRTGIYLRVQAARGELAFILRGGRAPRLCCLCNCVFICAYTGH